MNQIKQLRAEIQSRVQNLRDIELHTIKRVLEALDRPTYFKNVPSEFLKHIIRKPGAGEFIIAPGPKSLEKLEEMDGYIRLGSSTYEDIGGTTVNLDDETLERWPLSGGSTLVRYELFVRCRRLPKSGDSRDFIAKKVACRDRRTKSRHK